MDVSYVVDKFDMVIEMRNEMTDLVDNLLKEAYDYLDKGAGWWSWWAEWGAVEEEQDSIPNRIRR